MEIQKHHIKSEPCYTRPKYREGKIPRSVKVLINLTFFNNYNTNKLLIVRFIQLLMNLNI